MNTRIRRFVLRLIVGLLTFAAGVAAAMLLGGFTPFQGFAGTPGYQYREQRRYYKLQPEPAYEYPVYHEHGCKARKRMGQMSPLMPPPEPPPPPAMR